MSPRFVPVIVTTAPAAPEFGEMPVTVGCCNTVNSKLLLAKPFTVTTMGPEVAPLGTGTEMVVSVQFVGVPATPLNVRVLPFCAVPK